MNRFLIDLLSLDASGVTSSIDPLSSHALMFVGPAMDDAADCGVTSEGLSDTVEDTDLDTIHLVHEYSV